MYSKKDEKLGHYRRYNKKNLVDELKGFKIKNISYFNTFLFLPIMFITIINKLLKRDYINKVESTPNFLINYLLQIIFSSERHILKYFNLPFGVSIYILVKNV